MATTTNGSKRIFHNIYHYRTGYYNEDRKTHLHKGTDYGTSGKDIPQYPPLNDAIVREVVTKEMNGDARGCRVRMEWPGLNLGMILQHLVQGSIPVKVGDIIGKETRIGLTGMTGKYIDGTKVSTGVHAHVEVYYIDQGTKATFDFETLDFDDIENKYFSQEVDMTKEEVTAIVREILDGGDKPSSWAASEWAEATEKGLVDGSKPTGYPTREQLAAVALRTLKVGGKSD